MKLRDFLATWGLSGLKISLGFLEGEFTPHDADRNAAWDLYIELLTRTTTQHLPPDAGDERAALASVYHLFGLTREILKKHGAGASEFAKLAIPVLNQVVRPFTAKWHRLSLVGALDSTQQRTEYRNELTALQAQLRKYTKALSAMAGVEDLTALEGDQSD
jgi:hypothetical protein